jgi:hypothetical protein
MMISVDVEADRKPPQMREFPKLQRVRRLLL